MPRLLVLTLAVCMVCTAAGQAWAEPSWGIGLRAGTFGVPDRIMDMFLEKHPQVEGMAGGAEIRYYGEGGPRGVFSLGLAVDYGATSADGTWQLDKDDETVQAEGEVEMLAATLTMYWDIFPSWVVHPSLGLGLGAARVTASYRDKEDPDNNGDLDEWIPVLHVPVALVIRLGDYFTLRAEARFIDAVSYGGQLMINF